MDKEKKSPALCSLLSALFPCPVENISVVLCVSSVLLIYMFPHCHTPGMLAPAAFEHAAPSNTWETNTSKHPPKHPPSTPKHVEQKQFKRKEKNKEQYAPTLRAKSTRTRGRQQHTLHTHTRARTHARTHARAHTHALFFFFFFFFFFFRL